MIVAKVLYEEAGPNALFMRFQMYAIETAMFYDIFFATVGGRSSWWWLASDPSIPESMQSAAYGPFTSSAVVPKRDFLSEEGFSHAGSWKILSRMQDSFSGKRNAPAGTWYWHSQTTKTLSRIMNASGNDFKVPVFGAAYLVDFYEFQSDSNIDLSGIKAKCSNAKPASPAGSLLEAYHLWAAFHACPDEAKFPCTLLDIQSIVPGIFTGSTYGQNDPPSWTERVSSYCYMIGQDLYPYYCQLWYDWTLGVQVTVFFKQDSGGNYSVRSDEILPKGRVGPDIVYSWNATKWNPTCFDKSGGVVPMPVPNFVKADGGRCRAVIKANPYFGDMSIWSVYMGDARGAADFWYWFDSQQRGVLFSLAPAGDLTIIDYRTLVRDAVFNPDYLADRSNEVAQCGPNQILQLQAKPRFLMM
ncbi:hypothetical protein [Variovorax sp. dw_308]|uniref:hypothetical protein n=1 Tax=Variovorax sp. dw_308 TaxID=2721546 RepID=UPI001C450046|nr:hypothetical protein [Variovorax sp. dw_308]